MDFYWKNEELKKKKKKKGVSPTCDDQQKDRVMKDGRHRREYHILGSRYLTLASLAYIGGRYCSLVGRWGVLPQKKSRLKLMCSHIISAI